MALRLFTGNKLEKLAEALAGITGRPLASPLDEEVIVVQSQGMKRWVSLEFARHNGICANCRFYFPNTFVREVFRTLVPDITENSPFDPAIMTWRIRKLLPSCVATPGFESIRAYLGDPGGDLKSFQLSERIADTFDQYLLFRPEMVLGWEKGEGDHWQAVLWRELVRETGNGGHRAALRQAFFERVKDPSADRGRLPERVHIFGISALPGFHMEVLAGISDFVQVNLFLMNPCREYWGDILSDREMKRVAGREGGPEELHMERGNGLIASMGTLGRDFFDLVNEFEVEESTFFEDPGEQTLLASLQSDILNLRDREGGGGGEEPREPGDRSLEVHSCHSPMREIEVLQDRLLDMFERDPDLTPRDILVMAPDIEIYAPYVQAVFDLPAEDPRRIPFSISDRSVRRESEIVDAFLALVDLQGERFGVPQVLGLLESGAVRRKFGLGEADLDLVRRWVTETGIRWGRDGEARGRMGLPPFQENTWRAGLERLLLGYAMLGEGEHLFGGTLPYDPLEGGETEVLGGLLEFVETLFSRLGPISQPRTLLRWSESLTGLLEAFFTADEETESDVQVIRRALSELGEMQGVSGFDREVGIQAVRWHLGHAFEKKGFGFGFITRGVTFCAMLPMRSIPFKVICLVGMNSDLYPRQSRPLGFDLMARHPKPGDRSRRNDDRYLFLESILSARERLYISYVGRSIEDNSPMAPSVLVSELLDYVARGFRATGKNILDHIVTKHPLQAFSPAYFKGDERLFSYSGENLRAAGSLLSPRGAPVPFIADRLSEPDDPWKTVDLGDLTRFFKNPARFLLQKRVGIYLEDRAQLLLEREPFDVRGLERYSLESDLLEKRMAGRELRGLLPLIKASGRLPHGTVGECLYDDLSRGVESFAAQSEPYLRAGTPLAPIEVDLEVSGFRLTGRIASVTSDGLMQYRYGLIKPGDRLRVWLHHLALNSVRAEDCPRVSLLAGLRQRGGEREWSLVACSPVEESETILGGLLDLYWSGLRRPLLFFPEASWEYASAVLEKKRPEQEALSRARALWRGNDRTRGEREDPYYSLCFGDADPLTPEFQRVAREVFGPLLEHQGETRS